MAAFVSIHNPVLIPYISGLSFGGGLDKGPQTLILGLNPLYLGAIFRGPVPVPAKLGFFVLIPYISGLSFGV